MSRYLLKDLRIQFKMDIGHGTSMMLQMLLVVVYEGLKLLVNPYAR